MKRLMIAVFLAAAGVVLVVLALNVQGSKQRAELGLLRNRATRRGIEWLIQHKDIVPADDSVILFGELYKVAPDEETALKLLKIAKEKGSQSTQTNRTNADIYQSYSVNGRNEPYSHLETLLKRKCLGENVDGEIVKLKEDLQRQFPIGSLLLWYMLDELGIRDEHQYNQEVSDTYKFLSGQSDGGAVRNLQYFTTHVLLYESDFLNHRLDPKQYVRELDILNNYIDSIQISKLVVRANIDVLSEVLYSLKLLNQQQSVKVNNIYKTLIDVQNEDGSWSQIDGNMRFQFHNTVMAVLALIDFPGELRSKKLYCLSY